MNPKILPLLAALLVLLPPLAARAQCAADTDCKGEGLCGDGACAEPGPGAVPQPAAAPAVSSEQLAHPPPPPPVAEPAAVARPAYPSAPDVPAPPPAVPAPSSYEPQPSALQPAPLDEPGRLRLREPRLGTRPSSGWGRTAGITGLVLAGVTLGLAIGSELSSDPGEKFVLGFASFLAVAVSPHIAKGARSSRAAADVSGITALRIFGWVFFGVTLALPPLAIAMRGYDRYPGGLVLATGTLGALSFVCHSIDGLVAGTRAVRKHEGMGGIEVAHYLAPSVDARGRARLSVGLAGRF